MTPEMRQGRLGKMTASKAAVVMGGLNTKGLEDYVKTLAFERVYGDTGEEGYRSKSMERGNELEPRAIDWYCFENDCVVSPGGVVIDHPTIPFVSATPDAMRSDRCIEAKCLLHKAWMSAFEDNEIPSEYRWQCAWQQWVTGLHLVDFVVWHPVAGGFVIQRRVTPDQVEQMTERAFLVEEDVKAMVDRLRNRRESA